MPPKYNISPLLNSFGSIMEGRSYERDTSLRYRFGFNMQEKDDEVYGAGNTNTAEYWEYDCRLGRRWNIDPINSHIQSNFSCFNNNPIGIVDIKGLSGEPSNNKKSRKEKREERKLERAEKKFEKKIASNWQSEFNNQLNAITAAGMASTQADYTNAEAATLNVFNARYGDKRWFKRLTKTYRIVPSTLIFNETFYSENPRIDGAGTSGDPFKLQGTLSKNNDLTNGQVQNLKIISPNPNLSSNAIPSNSQLIMSGNFDVQADNIQVTIGPLIQSTGPVVHPPTTAAFGVFFPLMTMNFPGGVNTNTISVQNIALLPLPPVPPPALLTGPTNIFFFRVQVSAPYPWLRAR